MSIKVNEVSVGVPKLQSEQSVDERREFVIGHVKQADTLVRTVGGIQCSGTRIRCQ